MSDIDITTPAVGTVRFADQPAHQSPSIAKLATALAAAQGEMKHAEKSSDNPYYGSKYADLPAVIDACRPALSKHGLAVIQTTEVTEFVVDREHKEVVMVTTLVHSSGEWICGRCPIRPVKQKKKVDERNPTPPPAGPITPQDFGSAFTFIRRYTYQAITGVAAVGEDDDGNAASQSKQQSKPAATKGKADESVSDAGKRKKIAQMLLEMCDHDQAKARSRLKFITSFTGRDGTLVDGKDTTEALSPKALAVTLDKITKEYEVWKESAPVGVADEDDGPSPEEYQQ